MSIETLKNQVPDYAKDIKLNLSTLLGGIEPSNLDTRQIAALALAAAYATRQLNVIQLMQDFCKSQDVPDLTIQAVKAAASVMAMNNSYYRSVHWIKKDTYSKLPPGLRMQILRNHGILQQEFDLYCLAVSAINGCEYCVDAHVRTLEKAGLGTAEIQYSLRLAAVIQAFAQVLTIEAASL